MVSQFVGRIVILCGGGAAGVALMENKVSLGDISRSLTSMLMVGGGGSDRNLTNKVAVSSFSLGWGDGLRGAVHLQRACT